MEQVTQQVSDSNLPRALDSRLGYLKQVIAYLASLLVVLSTLYLGTYFFCVTRVVITRTVYEPPPLLGTRKVPSVVGAFYTNEFVNRNKQLFLPIHKIDKKWLRPKWWKDPQFTAGELAAMGITQK